MGWYNIFFVVVLEYYLLKEEEDIDMPNLKMFNNSIKLSRKLKIYESIHMKK